MAQIITRLVLCSGWANRWIMTEAMLSPGGWGGQCGSCGVSCGDAALDCVDAYGRAGLVLGGGDRSWESNGLSGLGGGGFAGSGGARLGRSAGAGICKDGRGGLGGCRLQRG